MRVLVSTEARFDRTPDGACWVIGPADYEFWKRYLDEFDEVRIVARMRDASAAPRGSVRADGSHVTLAGLPYYVGPWQHIQRRASIRRAIRELLSGNEAVIVRAPGPIGAMLTSGIRETDPFRPYGIEVVGDPYDVFAAGGVGSFLRPLLRWSMPRTLRKQIAGACAAAYVTQDSLQKRYPARADAFVTSYSSIDMPGEAFVMEPRAFHVGKPGRIIFVGTLEQLYKAPEVLIDAIGIVCGTGLDAKLTIIGDGVHRAELGARAKESGLADCVRFLGSLPSGQAIRDELDKADLFVLPSRAEGLPRAMIEAMARGVPCIGTNVGGIPELLAPSELIPPGDAEALAAKILEVLRDPPRLARLSHENLEKSRAHNANALRLRRMALYRVICDATRGWQQRSPLRD
ncbi:MAG: glycosyltransferase family 4 protein [Planctomycetes bacterium]|nr:glycosyltransferase family 4 protein [Planctomycetota bacterium]MBI3834807.1 glycosyltransferase family 4 protein [Planctomycetota bacterium]